MVLEDADLEKVKPLFPLEEKEGFVSMVEGTGMGSLTYMFVASSLLLFDFTHVPHSGKDCAENEQPA